MRPIMMTRWSLARTSSRCNVHRCGSDTQKPFAIVVRRGLLSACPRFSSTLSFTNSSPAKATSCKFKVRFSLARAGTCEEVVPQEGLAHGKTKNNGIPRRDFLRDAAAGARRSLPAPTLPAKQPAPERGQPPPPADVAEAELEHILRRSLTADRTGSTSWSTSSIAHIEYICSNPAPASRTATNPSSTTAETKIPNSSLASNEESAVGMGTARQKLKESLCCLRERHRSACNTLDGRL